MQNAAADGLRTLLERYVQLLTRYNERINLVSRQDTDRLWERHIEDSLRLEPLLQPGNLLDVGSGGGLPGIVLAIANPDRGVLLLERSQKKANFLRRVVAELALERVQVLCEDMDIGPGERALVLNISARAVASPAILWPRLLPWLAPLGQMLIAYGPQTRDQVPADAVVEWIPNRSHVDLTPATVNDGNLGDHLPDMGVVRLRRV